MLVIENKILMVDTMPGTQKITKFVISRESAAYWRSLKMCLFDAVALIFESKVEGGTPSPGSCTRRPGNPTRVNASASSMAFLS